MLKGIIAPSSNLKMTLSGLIGDRSPLELQNLIYKFTNCFFLKLIKELNHIKLMNNKLHAILHD